MLFLQKQQFEDAAESLRKAIAINKEYFLAQVTMG
jgi:Tfp pilus assembly protein PilF